MEKSREIVTSPLAEIRSASSFAHVESSTKGEISVPEDSTGHQYLHQSRAAVAPATLRRRPFLLKLRHTALICHSKSDHGRDAGDAGALISAVQKATVGGAWEMHTSRAAGWTAQKCSGLPPQWLCDSRFHKLLGR